MCLFGIHLLHANPKLLLKNKRRRRRRKKKKKKKKKEKKKTTRNIYKPLTQMVKS